MGVVGNGAKETNETNPAAFEGIFEFFSGFKMNAKFLQLFACIMKLLWLRVLAR